MWQALQIKLIGEMEQLCEANGIDCEVGWCKRFEARSLEQRFFVTCYE